MSEPLRRFLGVVGDTADWIKSRTEQLQLIYDVTNTPERFLEYIAANIGWNLNKDLELIQQRKELKNAVQVYKRKGTKGAIELVVSNVTNWEAKLRSAGQIFYSNQSESRTVDPTDVVLRNKIGTAEDEIRYVFGTEHLPNDYRFYLTAYSEIKGLTTKETNKVAEIMPEFAPIDMYTYTLYPVTYYDDEASVTVTDTLTSTLA